MTNSFNADDYLARLGIKPSQGTASPAPSAPAAKPAAAPIPPIPYNGFIPVGDGRTAINPSFLASTARGATPGAKIYVDSSGNWTVPMRATPDEVSLVRQGAAGTSSPAQVSPAPAATPAPQGAAPVAPTGTRTMETPASRGPATPFNVPGSYQFGPSGYTQTALPSGSFAPFQIQYGGANAPAPPAAPPPLSAPLAPTPSAGLATAPQASLGTPAPASTAAPQSIKPPSVGDAGLMNNQQAAPATPLAPDRQAFIDQMYPTAQAWSQQTGIPPEVYLAINGSESNFGKATSLFGVKGEGDAGSNAYATHEVVNGQNVPQTDKFANYSNPNAAYQGFSDFLNNNSRYAPAMAQFQQDHDAGALLQNINKAGYATDPNWANMIMGMAGDIKGALPVTPSAPPTAPAAPPVGWGLPAVANNLANPPDMWTRMINGTNAIPAALGATGPSAPSPATVSAAPSAPQYAPNTITMDGPTIAHLNGMNTGFSPTQMLRGNGIQSSGDAATDAVMAAKILQQQVPGGGYGDPLASKPIGSSGFYQSPLSGGLQNETRTDAGYAFSPGKVNESLSLRSPMNSGAYTPITTPGGVVIQGANNQSTPAAQAQAYMNAGYGVPQLDANGQRQNAPNTNTLATFPLAPTSNVGAVIQAAAAQQQAGAPVPYASAANLPSAAALQQLGAANAQTQADQDRAAAEAAAASGGGGGPMGGGNTQYFAQGGSFQTPGAGGIADRLGGIESSYGGGRPASINIGGGGNQNGPVDAQALQRVLKELTQNHPGYAGTNISVGSPMANSMSNVQHGAGPMGISPGYRQYAEGGTFLTTQPTTFPMANGGTAVTSEYGQPEKITVTPLKGYAAGGSFNTPGSRTVIGDDGTGTTTAPGTTAYDAPPDTGEPAPNQNYNAPPPAAPDPNALPNPVAPSAFGGAMDTNPELPLQEGLAGRQQARDSQAYLRRAAGVPDPIGISSATPLNNLGPSQYWAPIDYTNQIQSLQQRLAALGPVTGDPTQLAFDLQAAQNGYGGNGPGMPGWTNADPLRAAQIQQQLSNMTSAADLMSQIANLRANQPQLSGSPAPAYAQPGQSPITPTIPTKQNPTDSGMTLDALHQQASTPGAWTPQSSDALVQLVQSLDSGNRAAATPMIQNLTQQLGRVVPPGLNPRAYSNPVALAAAAKFAG